MIKSATAYSISQLFDADANVVYDVPLYQSEYTWGKWQWESMFTDISDNESGYFLGSIICINQSRDANQVPAYYRLDSQIISAA